MKRIIPLLTAISLMMSGCVNTRETAEVAKLPLVLTAYQEGSPSSKTAVEDGGQQVFWEPGDEIKVFSGIRTGKFTANVSGLTAVAEFTGHLEGSAPDVADIWAVYPYSDEASFDGENITTVIPSVQVARPGSFAQGANVAIAHSSTTNLQFYNVGGGIRFSLTENGVKKVIFEGLGGEVISGTVKVGFEEDLPKVQEVSGGSMFITLLPPEGESFATNTWYYLTAIPGALNSGFKLRFYKDDDTYAKVVSEKAMSIKRKVFGSLANVDTHIAYEATTTSFPETEEELEASDNLTTEIGQTLSTLLEDDADPSERPIEEIVAEVSEIEGVQAVVVNEDKTTMSIQQSDGIWLNLYLKQDNPIVPTGSSTNSSPRFAKGTSSIKRMLGSQLNKDKLALLLAPYQDVFQYNINDIKNDLLSAGFSEENIHYFPNNEADILKFRGSFLSKYSFILIMTHGGVAYRAKSPKGSFIENQSTLGSRTLYSPTEVAAMVEKGQLDWSQIAVSSSDKGKTWCLDMIPSMLEGATFDNSCVLLASCLSANILTEGIGNGSMIWTFLHYGAGAVTGFKQDINGEVCNPTMELLVKLMTHGVPFNEAYYYIVQSNRMAEMCNRAVIAYRNYSAKDYSASDFDVPLSFYHEQKKETEPYHLIMPSIELHENVTGSNVELMWESNVSSFDFDWCLCNESPLYSRAVINVNYPISYDIYINDQLVASRKGNSLQLTDCQAKTYSWKVVANILDGDNVISSFSSEESSFTISSSEAKLKVSRTFLEFDETTVGKSSQQDWTITNIGDATLTVSSLTAPDGFSTDFSDWSSKSLEPNESHTFKVTFQPTEVKTYSGKMVLKSNASNALEASFSVGGKGIAAPVKMLKSLALSTNYPEAYFSNASLNFSYDSQGRLTSVGDGMYTYSYSGNSMTFSDNGSAQLNSSGQFSSITWYRATYNFTYNSQGRLLTLNDSGMQIDYRWNGNDIYSITYSDGSTEMDPHFQPSSYMAPDKGVDINLILRIFLNEIGFEGVLPDGNCFPMMPGLIGKRSEHILELQINDTRSIDGLGYNAYSQYKGSDGRWHTLDFNNFGNWTEGLGSFEVKGSNVPYKLEGKSWAWTADDSGSVTKGVWTVAQHIASSVTGIMEVDRNPDDLNGDGLMNDFCINFRNGEVSGSTSQKNYTFTFTFGY